MSKNSEDLSDDFVASILSKEASEKNIRYSALGLQAFLPKRSTTNAPKPNTRFLRNIVREADSHNAALLAKEAEESKERLRILHLKERAKRRGEEVASNGVEGGSQKSRAAQRPDRQIYKVGAKRGVPTTRDSTQNRENRAGKENERKRRRSWSRDGREDERSKSHRSRSTDQRSGSPSGGRRHRRESRSRERKRSGEHRRDRSREHKRSRSEDRKKSESNKYHRHHSSRHHSSKDIDGSKHSNRSRSRERGIDKSPTSHRSDRKNHSELNAKSRSSRPRSPRRRPDESDADHERRRKRRKEMEMAEESDRSSRASTDPLLAIIGPAPPPPTRTRGRGTMSGSSAMDARFSEQYDPAMDVRPDADGEEDDWDNAIEAYRDRQKWKALGAERLRSAGFDEDFITAWENNDTKNTANIKWAKEGVREWDRGKVMVEGEVKVKASWSKD